MNKWTGELIGKMHNFRITYDELAAHMGISKGYISMVLNSKRTPAGAQERFEKALEEIICNRRQ